MSELVMYFLVRSDLKMSKGKTATQVGHAVQDLVLMCPRHILNSYAKSGHTKVILKVSNPEEMERISEQCRLAHFAHHIVVDEGRTQIEPSSKTVLGIGPVGKEKLFTRIPDLKELKLL